MLLTLLANLVILPVAITFFYDSLSTRWVVFNSISDFLFALDLIINFRTGKNLLLMCFILRFSSKKINDNEWPLIWNKPGGLIPRWPVWYQYLAISLVPLSAVILASESLTSKHYCCSGICATCAD